jgi:hypothetical protein
MRPWLWLCALCALLCVVWHSPARAQPGELVSISGQEPDAPLLRHLQVELTAAGYTLAAGLAGSELVVAADGAIEITVRDGAGGRLVRTQETPPEGESPRITALRAVELLRACLREAALRRPPPAPRVRSPGPARVVAKPEPSPSHFDVALGPALLASPGGLDAFAGIEASALLWPVRRWGLGVAGFVPLGSQQLKGPEGSAEVSLMLLAAGLVHRVALSPAWRLEAGAWGGVALLDTRGVAGEGALGGIEDRASAPAAHASLLLSYSLSETFYVKASLLLGVLLPELEVHFADRQRAHFGAPYGAGALGFGLRL